MRVATRTKRRTVTRRHDDVLSHYELTNKAHAALAEVFRDVQSAADQMALYGNTRPHYYRLNADKSVSPLSGRLASLEWSTAFGGDRRVAWDELEGVGYVSTVFLGIDHAYGDGPPQLFETMARIGDRWAEEVMRRYSTYEDAVAGHNELVAEHRAALAAVDKLKGAGDA